MNDMAKVFWSGRSQAVRLPKAFRFDGKEVRITREGSRVVLEPVETIEEDQTAWIFRMAGSFDEDFAKAVLDGRVGPDDPEVLLDDDVSFD